MIESPAIGGDLETCEVYYDARPCVIKASETHARVLIGCRA